MRKLDELIQKLCPNGVEFKSVEELFYFKNGKGHEQNIDPFGDYIVVNSKFISSDCKVFKKCSKQIEPVYIDDILMVMSDLPNGRALGKCFLVDENDKYSLNQRICSLQLKDKQKNLARFYYYVLNRNEQLLRYDNGVDQTNLKKEHITNIKIPVPPMEIQCEIIHILDQFTLLTAELTAELTARKQQYEYYRDLLFCFENKVEYLTLEEISNGIFSGKNKKRNKNGLFPIYGSTGIIGKTNTWIYDKKQILIARVGANAGFTHIANGKYDVSDNTLILDVKKEYSLKYVYYLLEKENLHKYAKGGGQPLVTAGELKKIKVPVPSLEEQQRIVDILDKFDSYCNDLTQGLPAEIELRKQQYGYYRDKLLTFKNIDDN